VSIETRLQAGRPVVDFRRGQDILLFSTAFTPPLVPTQPPFQWAPGSLSPGVKRPGREADHSSPSSTELKNGGAVPPLPYMIL
jgi:hypothetical protein